MYIYQVDVGDAGKKQVCTGLKGKYEGAELLSKNVHPAPRGQGRRVLDARAPSGRLSSPP